MNKTNTLTITPWNSIIKFLFRYFFVFCALLIFPLPGSLILSWLVEWSGNFFFNESVTYHPSGSGDTLYDFYTITITAILAFIGAGIWSLFDRKRNSYRILLYWQETYIRYYLGMFMLVYGFSKVIKTQFSDPSLSALISPLGNKSPMGLAWTFMGFSDTYTIFSGLCEVAAGLLLMYRKTRTLGAIVCFGVMLNVFLMNMSYDIPVKLFSLQLMLLAAFLIGLDYKRLVNFFILNKPTEAQFNRNPFKPKWANLTTQIVKSVAILAASILMIYNGLESQALYGDTAPKPAVYGIYEVEDFVINNDTLPPMLKDTVRWRYVVLDKGDAGSVFKMQTTGPKNMIYFRSKTDSINKHISFLSYQDSTEVGKFKYYKTDSIHYVFEGVFKNDTIKLNTIRTDEKDYLLTNRGFHWVNEYPYNR